MKILLLDDDPLTAAYLGEVVAQFATLTVVTRLTNAPDPITFDVLMVDKRLPDGDGWSWLAAQALLPKRVLRISGDEGSDLRKPIAPEALLEALGIVADVDDRQARLQLGHNEAAIIQLRAMLRAELAAAGVCRAADVTSQDIDVVHRIAAGARLVGFPRLAICATALERAWRNGIPHLDALSDFQRAAAAIG